MCSYIPILQWNKNQKDSDDFWYRKFTLKVQNWHFLTNCHQMETQNLVISFDYSCFLAKNLAYAECPIMKFHYWNSSSQHERICLKILWLSYSKNVLLNGSPKKHYPKHRANLEYAKNENIIFCIEPLIEVHLNSEIPKCVDHHIP